MTNSSQINAGKQNATKTGFQSVYIVLRSEGVSRRWPFLSKVGDDSGAAASEARRAAVALTLPPVGNHGGYISGGYKRG